MQNLKLIKLDHHWKDKDITSKVRVGSVNSEDIF